MLIKESIQKNFTWSVCASSVIKYFNKVYFMVFRKSRGENKVKQKLRVLRKKYRANQYT